MKNKELNIIYIGKAKNLRNRVSSYFRENPDHIEKVARMVENVYDYDFIVTNSEYEALVLECSLIKQNKPKYNILLKDDRGYHYIKVSSGEYPRVTAECKKDDDGIYFGPFLGSYATRLAVNEANEVFMLPLCKRRFPQEIGKGRPCLNFHIKQCMGVCSGNISLEKYTETINEAVDYIRNGSTISVGHLTESMELAADELNFERAAILRDRISAIKKSADRQNIFSDIPNTDIIAMAQSEQSVCVSILIYRNGRLFDKNDFFFNDVSEESVDEFIVQYYQNKEDIPREILIETEVKDQEIIEKLLKNRAGHSVIITSPKRGSSLKLIMLAKNNASEYLAIKVGRTGKEIIALEELSKLLGLADIPKYIEAYDISNLASTAMVAGMVVFENGRPLKSAYRLFSIKEVAIQNDYACMQEVLERRFKRLENSKNDGNGNNNTDDVESQEREGFARMPDLILLDGGKGHVNAVEPILKSMGINVPIFGMVKDSKHRTRAIATGGAEISISDMKPAFSLITKIQDEVHRFSIGFQRKRHAKRTYELELTKIKGIGEKKAMKLIQKYKTKEAFKLASVEEISSVAGVNLQLAGEIYEFIQNTK